MIDKVAELIVRTYQTGGKVLICGNGGLAAESEHFAAELMGKFAQDVYIPCIALTTNSSLVTAISNDMGFEDVFAHQVRVLGKPQDLLIGMTTSNSANVNKAILQAKMMTVVIGSRKTMIEAEYLIQLPGADTAEVQNEIIKFLHLLARETKRRVHDRNDC